MTDANSVQPALDVDPLGQFRPGDWVFMAMTWLTLAWTVFIILDKLDGGVIGFDYMPILAGIGIITFGWRMLRVGAAVGEAVKGLRAGAGLRESSDATAFVADFERFVRLASFVGGSGVGGMLAAFYAWALWFGVIGDGPAFGALLFVVTVGVGAYVGYLLGRLIGYGRMFAVMSAHGTDIDSLDTPEARVAMRAIESVYLLAFVSTTALCHWFGLWFTAWCLNLETEYRPDYAHLFLGLLAISVIFFLFGGRVPAIAFRRRFDRITGGATFRLARDTQLAAARRDLASLAVRVRTDREAFFERRELQALVNDLESRRFPPRLPSVRVINALAIWIVVVFLASAVWVFTTQPWPSLMDSQLEENHSEPAKNVPIRAAK